MCLNNVFALKKKKRTSALKNIYVCVWVCYYTFQFHLWLLGVVSAITLLNTCLLMRISCLNALINDQDD